MGVVSVSTSAAGTPLGLNTKFSSHQYTQKRPLILAFRGSKSNNTSLVSPKETHHKRVRKNNKSLKRLKAVFADETSPSSLDVDYNEAATKLENIYELSPASDTCNAEDIDSKTKRVSQRRKNVGDEYEEAGINKDNVVRNQVKKVKRLSLDKRIALKNKKEEEVISSSRKKRNAKNRIEKIDELLKEYSASTDIVSLDWKKLKIPRVLPSSEHARLFKLMQPIKALLQVKEDLQELGAEPTDGELAETLNMSVVQVKKAIEVGQAARNKLIKHNLRLVLFVINKYFQYLARGPKFQDLFQAGVKGLITAIDRFEPNRRFQLSTYSLFWIRCAILRSITLSSFTRVPFGLEKVRVEIQRVKLELTFELQRSPTEEEIVERVGISPGRYHEVMKASKPILSLNSRHTTTQEEFVNGITDVDGDNATCCYKACS